MDSERLEEYSTEVGIKFLQTRYALNLNERPNHCNAERLRHLRKLSEFQLHGAAVLKRQSGYEIPVAFCAATDAFLIYRRFEGIVEKNVSTISLYLERFFSYLKTQSV